MSINKYIPNFVTLLNLFCGSIAVIFAVHNNFVATAIFVFLGVFFDFFDGLLARKLNVQSPLGVQLDSLADMVTSGLVPGIVMFKLMSISFHAPEMQTLDDWSSNISWSSINISLVALIGLFITLASAYRLAKFNIDEEQQTYFKGLPTPANTLLVISLPLIIEFQNSSFATNLILNPWFLIAFTALSCYLLNSKIKLFALKFKDYSFANNKIRYVLIISTILLLVVFQFIAIPLIIMLYILLSVFQNMTTKTI
ncbi:CDP-alcohol phosphatidyltransferase family protein [Psychroserpens damuponensis]|uniref:CDP-alcohol phosphatidyltransferase family protein n=1 Tax=Psychroserpens damuponensis TaxID=943936 RepID=UPI00058AD221|nr:CDP-alcohol phosphatidyltransferase family protein [Psychroserpens damuponensis]